MKTWNLPAIEEIEVSATANGDGITLKPDAQWDDETGRWEVLIS